MKTLKHLWRNIFNFHGTAGRGEFFRSLLVNIIAMYVMMIPFMVVCAVIFYAIAAVGVGAAAGKVLAGGAAVIYIGIFMIPLLSLLVRRMRDSGFSMKLLVLLLIAIPVLGFLLIGMMKKSERAYCWLSKIGYTLFVGGFGTGMWAVTLSGVTGNLMLAEGLGTLGVVSMVIGLGAGYIGTKIDDKVNKTDSSVGM